MKRGLLAAALLLTATILLSGQEVRRALPAQSVAADDVARFLAGCLLRGASPLSALRAVSGVCRRTWRPSPVSPSATTGLISQRCGHGVPRSSHLAFR